MFFYDAPKISLSRICKSKSHLLVAQLYSVCVLQFRRQWVDCLGTDRSDLCEPNKNQPESN